MLEGRHWTEVLLVSEITCAEVNEVHVLLVASAVEGRSHGLFCTVHHELPDIEAVLTDFNELSKLAIDYSDGVIQASKAVNESLLKYAADKNVPLLDYHEDFADYYEDFYNQICPDDAE